MIEPFTDLAALRARTAPAADRALLASELDDLPPGGALSLPAATIMTPLVLERALTLRGAVDGLTILAGEPGDAAIEVTAGDGAEVVLEGLVIVGGGGPLGAIAVRGDRPRVVLRDCVVLDGAATGDGAGGVTISSGRLVCERTVFAGNRGRLGGALSVLEIADLEARACLFWANEGKDGGGAVWLEQDVDAQLVNCTFLDDRSGMPSAGQTLHARYMRGRAPQVRLVSCVVRSRSACFGYGTPGYEVPVRLRACTVPDHARRHPQLEADEATAFAEVELGPGLAASGAAGDPDGAPQEATDLFGRPLRSGAGVVRGAVAP